MPNPPNPLEGLGLGNTYTPGDPSTEALRDLINLKFAARGTPCHR